MLQPDPMGLGTQFKGEPLPNLRNADGASCDVCDLKQAMTISNNVIYHELAQRIGPRKVADAAKLAGITTPLTNPDAGIALGDKEVTPVELASAYATIAAGGVYHQPHLVSKVTTSDDRVLYDAVTPGEQRFGPQVARNVIEAMLGVPTVDKLDLSGGRPVAAKTGTVQSHVENQNNDAWTAGFTPQVASVVWIGTDQNSPIKNAKGAPISGSGLPGSIWKNYMYDATRSRSAQSFGPFKPLGTPPATTGQYDGFAATTPHTPSETPSSIPSTGPSEVPGTDGTRSGQSRGSCDDLGCGTQQDDGHRAGPTDSGNAGGERTEAQPRAESGTADDSGTSSHGTERG
jgi:membrane peptidoglycan carboxypeptidase